jgi:hypothetical protein
MSQTRPRPPSRQCTTTEIYTLGASAPRLGFVQYQLGLARLSISLQVPRAARAALLVLTPDDFPADPDTAHAYLSALRDPGLSAHDITAAVEALTELASPADAAFALRPTAG